MPLVIVGAGPAGMMAAIRAGLRGCPVTLLEKNGSPGAKLILSGKGRCNLTNACDLPSFLQRFSGNAQFLRDAFKAFFYPDLMRFFEERGVQLTVERQSRVFPASGRAASILEALKKELGRRHVTVLCHSVLKKVIVDKGAVKAVLLADGKTLPADRLILATGGASYGATGSTGEGIAIAAALGHRTVPLRPGLVGLATKEQFVRTLEGLTLRNVRITFRAQSASYQTDVGELLFTDKGISGPLVISSSGKVSDWLSEGKRVAACVDLKPGVSQQQLETRLLRECRLQPRVSLRTILKGYFPQRFANTFLNNLEISPQKKANQLTAAERHELVRAFKGLCLEISETEPLDRAMVTRGGVSLKDIDPRTMASRIVKGLYFAGEMIDVDGDTGGFNLQAAFSTGYLAGESAAQRCAPNHHIGSGAAQHLTL